MQTPRQAPGTHARAAWVPPAVTRGPAPAGWAGDRDPEPRPPRPARRTAAHPAPRRARGRRAGLRGHRGRSRRGPTPRAARPGPSSPRTPWPAAATSSRTRTRAPATTAGSTRCAEAAGRGHGPVPWEHEPNRGFLRALDALAVAADRDRRGRRGRALRRVPARQRPRGRRVLAAEGAGGR